MVFSMISNLATLALALTIRAKPFDMDVVFWSEEGCSTNGSFKSYLVNIATNGCTGPCLNLANKYGAVQINDPSHDSSCYFYQNSNNCSGDYTLLIQNLNSSAPNPSCTTILDPISGDIQLQGSVRCFQGQCSS